METKLKMVYWKGDRFWVGKLLEHPEIITQGETLEELEENMKDAYMLMTLEDVPEDRRLQPRSLGIGKSPFTDTARRAGEERVEPRS